MLLGDVRDSRRIVAASSGVDVLIHAGALKRADALEYNALEAVHTNVSGSENVVAAAIESRVTHAVLISSDKAVRPANIYGATKMIAEQLFLRPYTGTAGPTFSVCRFGNFIGSRGSVVPMWRAQRERGEITITEAAAFVLRTIESGVGGLHVPKMRALRVMDLAAVIADGVPVREVGPRVGEKIHEELGDGRSSGDGPFMSEAEIRAMLTTVV